MRRQPRLALPLLLAARSLTVLCAGVVLLGACRSDVFERVVPTPPSFEAYVAGLQEAGLEGTLLVRRWTEAGAAALRPPTPTSLPARPAPAFDAAAPSAWSARLDLRRGEVLRVEIVPALGADSARVFADLFRAAPADSLPVGGHLWGEVAWSSTDSTGARADTLRYERRLERDEALVLRVQPEVLAAGTVDLRVETAPSLAFPVADVDEDAIRSYWGAPRDGGARQHEGVDIFAPRGTPAVASARGRVTRVQETPLGGRVVWLRISQPRAALYYAHLDSQLVREGQRVQPGDTLGLVGNTGNARSTPPHLHFGVYSGGAVDPFPYLVGRRPTPRVAAPLREAIASP